MQCMNFILEILHVGWRSKLALKQHKHFHPSGSLSPSKEDVMITDRMIYITELLGIHLLDHIIVGTNIDNYFSFHEKKILDNPLISYKTNYRELEFHENKTSDENKSCMGRIKRKGKSL